MLSYEIDFGDIFKEEKVLSVDSPPPPRTYFPIFISKNWHKRYKGKFNNFGGKILKMEVYKLGRTIENQNIEIQVTLHQLKEARDELQHSLKRRKEIAIQQDDTQYKEINTTRLFKDGNLGEFNVVVANLM